MEVSVGQYYAGRYILAGYDIPDSIVPQLLKRNRHNADVIVAEPKHTELLEHCPEFMPVCDIRNNGRSVRLIYVRRNLNLPEMTIGIDQADAEYAQHFTTRHVPKPLLAPEGFEGSQEAFQNALRVLKEQHRRD
jgi:hypothetical protein